MDSSALNRQRWLTFALVDDAHARCRDRRARHDPDKQVPIVFMNALSNANRKLSSAFCRACAASVRSSSQARSNWSNRSWSASVSFMPNLLVDDLDDA
jgi:hypothetical protein